MTAEAAPQGLDLNVARILHAALGLLLGDGPAAPKLLYSPEEAAERLGLDSTNQLYRKAADLSWPSTLIADRLMFSAQDLERIVEIQGRGDRAGKRLAREQRRDAA